MMFSSGSDTSRLCQNPCPATRDQPQCGRSQSELSRLGVQVLRSPPARDGGLIPAPRREPSDGRRDCHSCLCGISFFLSVIHLFSDAQSLVVIGFLSAALPPQLGGTPRPRRPRPKSANFPPGIATLPFTWASRLPSRMSRDAGVKPGSPGGVVIASAWQPRRGRKFELEVQPFITELNTGDKSLDKDPAKRVASICSPQGWTIRSRDRHREHSSPELGAAGTMLRDRRRGVRSAGRWRWRVLRAPVTRAPRQTEHSGSISAWAPIDLVRPPQLLSGQGDAEGAPKGWQLGW
jgi:hypothetical protein